jgi:hypothetical protein
VDGKAMTELSVCAVATVLAIRLFLAGTNYSQFGGGGLHTAHLLWGGALLAVAALLGVSLITRASRRVAAFLEGVGSDCSSTSRQARDERLQGEDEL